MTEKIKNSLDFVVRHYRPGAFRRDDSFIRGGRSVWRRRLSVAAAVAGVLLVSAAVYTYVSKPESKPESAPVVQPVSEPTAPQTAPDTVNEVKRIEFSDAPLNIVVSEIESTYGVKVAGLSADDANRLTLSYEGTAEELVATINELLGTNLTIER